MSSAALVSEVLISLKEPPGHSLGLNKVAFYLDAPVVMDLIGCTGRARQRDATFVVGRLKSEGARLRVLSVGIEEIHGNLTGYFELAPNRRHGPSLRAINAGETTEVYLRQVLSNPERFVQRAGIDVIDVDTARFSQSQTNAFPESAADELLSRISGGYRRITAAERDAASVAYVQRSRGFGNVSRLSDAKHIFVTRNDKLHARVRAYFRDRKFVRAGDLGPTIEAEQLTAIVWLGSGNQERVEIDQRHLLLNSARIVETAPSAVSALRDRLQEISPETAEQFEALLEVPRCEQFAADYIGGSVPRAMEVDPMVVFEKVRRSTAAELEQEYEQRAAEQTSKHEEQLRDADRARRQVDVERLAAESARAELERKVRQHEQSSQRLAQDLVSGVLEQRQQVNGWLRRVATWLCIAWMLIGLIVIFAGDQWPLLSVVEKSLRVPFGPVAVLLGIWLGQKHWERLLDSHWHSLIISRAMQTGVIQWLPENPLDHGP